MQVSHLLHHGVEVNMQLLKTGTVSVFKCHMYDFIIHIFVCIYVYVLQISSWPTDLSCSETVVRSFHILELKIAVRPVGFEPFP